MNAISGWCIFSSLISLLLSPKDWDLMIKVATHLTERAFCLTDDLPGREGLFVFVK
jgi:hypothetical protein